MFQKLQNRLNQEVIEHVNLLLHIASLVPESVYLVGSPKKPWNTKRKNKLLSLI